MIAEIAYISQALIGALAEAHAMVHAGTFDAELVEVVRHARELGELLREATERAGDEIDGQTREMAATLAAAVESLEAQLREDGALH